MDRARPAANAELVPGKDSNSRHIALFLINNTEDLWRSDPQNNPQNRIHDADLIGLGLCQHLDGAIESGVLLAVGERGPVRRIGYSAKLENEAIGESSDAAGL